MSLLSEYFSRIVLQQHSPTTMTDSTPQRTVDLAREPNYQQSGSIGWFPGP